MGIWTREVKPDKEKLIEFLQQTYPDAHNVTFDTDNRATMIELPTIPDPEMKEVVAALETKFPEAFE